MPDLRSPEARCAKVRSTQALLHRYPRLVPCLRRRSRPWPAFLMLDQPSQAHYPPEHDANGLIPGLADEDQAAVHRLFKLLSAYCVELTPRMQVIVSDHVELLDDWFRDAIVQRWRDGIKLVPVDWLTAING